MKIRWQPMPITTPSDDEEEDDDRHPIHLDALKLAQHLELPLLVDDRLLQVARFQNNSSSVFQAFGTDCVLKGMINPSKTNLKVLALAFRRLMRWRYRFLVPTAEFLLAWAEESLANLPGPALLESALYLHDSLRDPGLHCGPEQTDPPTRMAVRLVTAWMSSIVTFLSRAWDDEQFTDDNCVGLTRWVVEELVPSCPRGLWLHEVGHNIAEAERESLFNMAAVQFVAVRDPQRANLGLRTLAAALGYRDDQYLSAVVRAIHASSGLRDSHGAEQERAFSQLMLQMALLHYIDQGITSLPVSQFKELGLLEAASPPAIPAAVAGVLRGSMNSADAVRLGGPLILVVQDQVPTVVQIETLLLHPDDTNRISAIDYLQTAASTPSSWLTPRTIDIINKHASSIRSEHAGWRSGAIEVSIALQSDYFAHLAGLRQSIVWRYQEGMTQFLSSLMHPDLSTLFHLRPPLWSPSEQRDEIVSWIEEASRLPSLDAALSNFVSRCGYVPLRIDLAPPRVVSQWMQLHPDKEVSWQALWNWALGEKTPFAKYHAITIALHIPSLRPQGSHDSFWNEVARLLTYSAAGDQSMNTDRVGYLYCELASHFARHIEALLPGQHGERVACYAWWLADMVGKTVGPTDHRAENFIQRIHAPEAQYSFFRWAVARSPVVPSPLRYATLYLKSIWGMSLVAHISSSAAAFHSPLLSIAFQEVIGKALQGYLFTSQIATPVETANALFPFQDNAQLEDLCAVEGFIPETDRKGLADLITLRRRLSGSEGMEECLAEWDEVPAIVQHLAVLSLKTEFFSTTRFDETFSKWLDQTTRVIDLLLKGPDHIVIPFLEVLAEFQQHQVAQWPIRLPHLIAYAIDLSDDSSRTDLLLPHLLHMTINYGLGSPLQRLGHSKKRADFHHSIGMWRDNLLDLAPHSEAWVAARVRATSASISGMIGPSQRDVSEIGPAPEFT